VIGLDRILLICLWAFGVSWIIADSKISLPIRHWIVSKVGSESLLIQFLECPPCMSFWIGLFTGFLVYNSAAIAIVLAPVCTATSIVTWSFVNRS
jgi:hypothetical protein